MLRFFHDQDGDYYCVDLAKSLPLNGKPLYAGAVTVGDYSSAGLLVIPCGITEDFFAACTEIAENDLPVGIREALTAVIEETD